MQQATIKGLTPAQLSSLLPSNTDSLERNDRAVSLILNNTYHLNLRPGINILDQVGGAHAFQGWNRNLLTARYSFSSIPERLYVS